MDGEAVCRAEFAAYREHVATLYASHLAHVAKADETIAALHRRISDVRNIHERDKQVNLEARLALASRLRWTLLTAGLGVVSSVAAWLITHL